MRRKGSGEMACEICGRNACTKSFHSLREQEEFDNVKKMDHDCDFSPEGLCYICGRYHISLREKKGLAEK